MASQYHSALQHASFDLIDATFDFGLMSIRLLFGMIDTMIEFAAILSCVVLAGLTVFQIALISGAPIGTYAWGGAHETLPLKLRIGSVVSIVLYGIFAIIILEKAQLTTLTSSAAIIDIGIWVLAIYFCIGIPLNALSRSKPERNLMTPIVLLLAASTLFLALN